MSMSVIPKSKVSSRKLALKSSVVTSIDAGMKRKGNRNESLLAFDRERLSNLKKTLPLQISPEKVIPSSRKRQQKRTHKLNDRTIKILPESQTLPTWLQIAIGFQRRFSIGTLLLVSAVLAVYSSTVYSQQLWSQKYRQLEALRRQERQVTAASEVLKNQLANQAEQPDNGLVSPNPENNLFLEPSPVRSPAVDLQSSAKPVANPEPSSNPIGY